MLKGSVAVRRASVSPMRSTPPFPAIAVDSLHHHPINNHNSHQHMARVKASSRSASSSTSSSTSCSSGASSRLRSVSPAPPAPSPDSLARKEKEAEDERLAPRQFVERYSLPRVVRVVSGQGQAPGQAQGQGRGQQRPMTGPLAQPLLLYRQYSTRKVAARSLQRDGRNMGAELGPPLVLPDSYQGWFSLVRERSLQTRAKVYTTVGQLVDARVAAFLTKNAISGLRLAPADAAVATPTPGTAAAGTSGGGGGDAGSGGISLGLGSAVHGGRRMQYVRTTVRAGQVLRLLAVFEDSHHVGRSSTRDRGLAFLGGRAGLGAALGGSDAHGPQYAQCLTHRNEELFVPVSTSGQFYVVNTADPATSSVSLTDPDLSRVYQLPQLLRLTSDPLPVKVQLVCGPVQAPLPPGFTGLLLLESVQRDDVILACTLPRSWALPTPTSQTSPSALSAGADGCSECAPPEPSPSPSSPSSTEKPIFLEMDADSRFLLMRPLANREAELRFYKTPLVQRVLSYCRERAHLWCSQIKVTHHIFPTPSSAANAGKAANPGKEKARQACNKSKRILPPTPPASNSDVSSSSSSGNRGALAMASSWGGSKKSASFRYASPSQAASPSSGTSPTSPQASSPGPSLLQQIRSRLLHRSCSAPTQAEEDQVHISDIFPELRGERPAPAPAPAPAQLASVSSSRQLLRFYADELPYGNVVDAIVPQNNNGQTKNHDHHYHHHHHHHHHHHTFEVDEEEEENIYAEICECPRNSVVSGAKVILRTTCSTERSGYFTFQSANSVGSCYHHLGGSDGTLSGTMSSSNPSNPEDESVYDTVC